VVRYSSEATSAKLKSGGQTFLVDVVEGLRHRPKSLPCKYLYDRRGSMLFDRICGLAEYYVTRAELAIMRRFAAQMGDVLGPRVLVIEYGSGSSVKTRLLLDNLVDPAGYVPVDISQRHLKESAERLAREYPHVEVSPVCGDFTCPFELPETSREAAARVVYFPGSTIGNFDSRAAVDLLSGIAGICGLGGGLLIGIDLKKDRTVLEAAYNDRQGVTAAFNMNLLRRINRELGADFDLDRFEHRAVYNESAGRIEIGLVSRCRQEVVIAGERFELRKGEEIRTEHSHKYTLDQFTAMASEAGLKLRRYWTDSLVRFAVLYFEVAG